MAVKVQEYINSLIEHGVVVVVIVW